MAEKEQLVKNQMKYDGIFNLKDFYKFCYKWLTEETELGPFAEKKYEEKLKGNKKDIEIKWEGMKKLTDYFRMDIKVDFEILNLEKIEINEDGTKKSTNKGSVKVTAKGILVRDYDGKFESSGFLKFIRSIYEKWVIRSRIDDYEEHVDGKVNDFLDQAKAYLDMEGKK